MVYSYIIILYLHGGGGGGAIWRGFPVIFQKKSVGYNNNTHSATL